MLWRSCSLPKSNMGGSSFSFTTQECEPFAKCVPRRVNDPPSASAARMISAESVFSIGMATHGRCHCRTCGGGRGRTKFPDDNELKQQVSPEARLKKLKNVPENESCARSHNFNACNVLTKSRKHGGDQRGGQRAITLRLASMGFRRRPALTHAISGTLRPDYAILRMLRSGRSREARLVSEAI
jgi:hypothetical protein